MKTMNRRQFLRAAGLTLALPALESSGAPPVSPPRRFIGINNGLGFHLPLLVPKQAGADYELTPYLAKLGIDRSEFTLISGLHHTGVDGGHNAEKSFLSGALHPGHANFKNTVSLDQLIAENQQGQTRLHSLNLRTSFDGGSNMSCNSRGQLTPVEQDPKVIFERMFLTGTGDDTERIIAGLNQDRSLLDHVLDDAKRLQAAATAADRDRLDEYFTALRDVEQNLQRKKIWAAKPKPRVDYEFPKVMPVEADIIGLSRILLDLSALAIRTDSTRSIALKIFGHGARPPIPGVKEGYHALSHHGMDDQKIAQLALIEKAILATIGRFIRQLADAKDVDGQRLLDRTTILFGSSIGNASSHDNRNLPILLAGGGFKHGSHLAHDPKTAPPLANLYLSILHHHGIEAERFASSTGTFSGLDGV